MADGKLATVNDQHLEKLYYNAMELMSYKVEDIIQELRDRKLEGPWCEQITWSEYLKGEGK